VGLPWANAAMSRHDHPPWGDARRECVLRLLRAGRYADWSARTAHVDAYSADVEGDLEDASVSRPTHRRCSRCGCAGTV
jgi:hypothetical protein